MYENRWRRIAPPYPLPHPLTFFAYGKGRQLMAQERIADGQVEPVIERKGSGVRIVM